MISASRKCRQKPLFFCLGAGMKVGFSRGGSANQNLSKIHCRSIDVDLARGSVNLFFPKIHCRFCWAVRESGSANRVFSKLYRRSISTDGASGSVKRNFSKIHCRDSFQRQCKSRKPQNIPPAEKPSGIIFRLKASLLQIFNKGDIECTDIGYAVTFFPGKTVSAQIYCIQMRNASERIGTEYRKSLAPLCRIHGNYRRILQHHLRVP